MEDSTLSELDKKIREHQLARLASEELTRASERRELAAKEKAQKERLKAINDFVAAFNKWQSSGYSFGPGNRELKLEKKDEGWFEGEVGTSWSKASGENRGQLYEYVKVMVKESSAPPPDYKTYSYADLYGNSRRDEKEGVLVQGTIEGFSHVYYGTGSDPGPSFDVFEPTTTYTRFFRNDELGKIEEALVPLLDKLVDTINAPILVDKVEAPEFGGPA